MAQEPEPARGVLFGRVISLDRGYPLVRTKRGELRAQHAIDLVKNLGMRAAVGDFVEVYEEEGQDTPFITHIQQRTSTLIRRELVESIHDGTGKSKEQILATNFDFVAIVQSLGKKPLNLEYLERQLTMAHASGVEVIIILTKTDLARHKEEDIAAVQAVAPDCLVRALAMTDDPSEVARLFLPNRLGVLLGRSGVGKSTLVNRLMGEEVQVTGKVRQKDNAGRHVTVARRLLDLPEGGAVIDTPGMRAIGVLGAELGLTLTFTEITELAADCRYRDCTHTHEPGCKVIEAVSTGVLTERRLESYRTLAAEVFD